MPDTAHVQAPRLAGLCRQPGSLELRALLLTLGWRACGRFYPLVLFWSGTLRVLCLLVGWFVYCRALLRLRLSPSWTDGRLGEKEGFVLRQNV